jgi:hypothetical protein
MCCRSKARAPLNSSLQARSQEITPITKVTSNDGTDKAYIVRKVAGNATDFSLRENEHDLVTRLRPDCSRRGFRTAS